MAVNQSIAEEIWQEKFSEPEKGIWGDGNGNLLADFSGITTWSLDYNSVEAVDADDYAKTVTTSGGRSVRYNRRSCLAFRMDRYFSI